MFAVQGAVLCLLVLAKACTASSDHPGWETWLSDNLKEFENVPVAWDNASAVPEWLKGTYVKNGGARMEFGGELEYANLVDAWAKITKFNIDSTGLSVSSKFLKTDLYQKCEAAQEIVPQITMGPVVPDNWGMGDFPEIGTNNNDNTMVTVTKMGSRFIASTDLPKVNIFDMATLEWVEWHDPKLGSTMSSAHWMKEPGTDNMLNYQIKGSPGLWETLHLYRYPGGDLHNPQEVGSGFHLDQSTMIHMFSVTENYAIFFIYPIHIDMTCAVTHLLHNMLECVKWEGERQHTEVYVMSLATGEIVSKTTTDAFYSTHHVNAYEKTENDLEMVVVDLVIPPWYALSNFTDKNVMLNWVDSGAMENLFEIRRVEITTNLSPADKNQIFSSSWENNSPSAQPYYNQFDFPKINPNYEGRHYCYAYGQAIVEEYRQYLVKKHICDSTEDKVWWKENHYTGEPFFVPRPGATEEDDGVVIVIVFDGVTELSYLLLLDGQTFETVAEARLDTYIPMSIHGNWFPEIL